MALFLVVIFLFVQLNLKLFPLGLELEFWKNFGLTFPGLKRCFSFCIVIYQILLLWWTPLLTKVPSLAGEIASYSLITFGNVECAERVYAATHKNDGSSFAARSTYALMNRGVRRADDPKIDDAIVKVYGNRSPQMQERKRLLADFILMTKGEVPKVEELRNEARAIGLEKCSWETSYLYRIGEKPYFYDQEKFPLITKAFEEEPIPAKIEITPELLSKTPCGGLIGAPVDPRYERIMMEIPKIYCFPFPNESDGRPATARLSYRAQFRDYSRTTSKSDKVIAYLLLLFVPASFFLTLGLGLGKRILLERLSRRWKSESLLAKDWKVSYSAANSLVALERLRGNLDEADRASLRMLDLAERSTSRIL
ncbi:MAG: hypothetical protein SFY67_05335 [Candidatus Melainabacteria bacterium]|nr:hypothetical protein [Candidatus Melainabacteria bacterium]